MKEAEDTYGTSSSNYRLTLDAETGNISVVPAWRYLFDDDENFDEKQDEAHQSLNVSVENMQTLRAAYPNYFLDVRTFLDVMTDLCSGPSSSIGSKKYFEKMDLSFLKSYKK